MKELIEPVLGMIICILVLLYLIALLVLIWSPFIGG